MVANNWNKFRALVWKTWLLEFNNKLQLVLGHIVSIIFLVILIPLRIYTPVEFHDAIIYKDPLAIDNLKLFKHSLAMQNRTNSVKFHLAYAPNASSVFENIVKEAATSLHLTYNGYVNAEALENALIDENYLAGVEFDGSPADYPQILNYKLRFPSELRTDSPEKMTMWMTNHQFLALEPNGPRNQEDKDGGIPSGYLREGFLPVQHAISMAFIRQAAANYRDPLPQVFLQRYPYPSYILDKLVSFGTYMGLIFCMIFLVPCIFRIKIITIEKEKQIKEVMKIMGVQDWLRWVACFVNSFISMAFFAIMITIIITVKWNVNGSLITHSSVTLLLFFFLVFSVAILAQFFLLSTFLSKSIIAAIVAEVVFYIMIAPYLAFTLNYDSVSLTTKLLWSLIPNTALCLGVQAIFVKEAQGDGIKWSNMFNPVSVDDTLSLGLIIIMMLVSGAVHMTLCLYVEQIRPGEFGVPKNWYFPFKRTFWTLKQETGNTEDIEIVGKIQRDDAEAFEEEPRDARFGLQIQNLTKTFGEKTAVNNVSLNLYENETTVLLGHNGAGKTTLVSMLTGMIQPTSGTATINGSNIITNLQGARMSLGICPQRNILFDELTVKQHLVFYSRLKGLEGNALQEEVNKYMKKIDLEHKANVKSSKLSGGMKRKLSVCSAFCGGTKVVLCDEPSSGMDPAARRQLWDLIISEKIGRTVLLTTHFMDEADALGDRIAIMSDGDLKCVGTPFFLKKKYGSGYHLICIKKYNCDSAEVTAFLKKYVPNIEPATDVGSELSYRLPDMYSSIFQAMFEDLESNFVSLSIDGYGISIASLEDVFMKVGTEINPNGVESDINGSFSSENIFSSNQGLLKGTPLILNQWRSMIMKKYLYTIRNKIMFAVQNFVPIIFVAIIWFLTTSNKFSDMKPLLLDLHQFPRTVTILETNPDIKPGSLEANISNYYQKVVNSFGPNHEITKIRDQNFIDYILALGKTLQVRVNSRYIAAATVDKGKITAWLNNNPLHSAPITLNLIHNAIARAVMGPEARIHVTNKPLPYSRDTVLKLLNTNQNMGYQIKLFAVMCMCFVAPLYVAFLIKERESRAKLVQFVCGLRATIFWLSNLLCDYITLMITITVMLIAIACCQVEGFATFDEIGRLMVIFAVFGGSVLLFVYLLSSLASDPANGYTRALQVTHITLGLYIYLPVDHFARGWLMTSPIFTLMHAMTNFYQNSQTRKACKRITEILSETDRCEAEPVCCKSTPYFAWEAPGVLEDLTVLFLSGLVFFAFLILNDSHITKSVWSRKLPKLPERKNGDEDVEHEQQRVMNMFPSEIAENNLVVNKLTKFYKKFLAVNRVSLVVGHSECFGLLGVNGAGKTTLFKMLTGDVKISSGEAYIKGLSLERDITNVFQDIGYCPQSDALFDEFTGCEMLKIYCLLRGIPNERIPDLSNNLANQFRFVEHYNKRVKAYSGGNKRKLSAAITMIGSPSLIFLDEPTSGMDPGARRQLWNMICKIRETGRSVILTSHNMEECEALCTRLAIMVKGEFKCIGSVQHLKNKFTKGLTLKIKMKKYDNRTRTDYIEDNTLLVHSQFNAQTTFSINPMRDDIEKIKKFVGKEFSSADFKDHFQDILTFYIPLTGTLWSRIFGIIESNKEDLNIVDYSINQTSLQEIFLMFAQQQNEK